MNPSGIKPMEYMVLVAPKKVEEKTTGGIYLPDSHKEKEQHAQKQGVLIAKSPLAFNYDTWAEEDKPQIGQRVLFFRYQADEVRGVDGETYWLMKDKSIAGVYDDR